WLDQARIPEDLASELIDFFSGFEASQTYAVRSSANFEDSKEHSFAGIFESFLNVEPQYVLKTIEKVFESSQTQRSQSYCRESAIDFKSLRMSSVVMPMVSPRVSGVVFSRSPKGDSSQIIVEACLGLGTGVVEGSTPTEIFVISRWNLESVLQNSANAILSKQELLELQKLCLRLENHFEQPVDVEWCFDLQGKLWLLQCRPITQNFSPLQYFTDANLIESYPGKSLPITCDLVKHLYKNTFTDVAHYLGADSKRLQELAPFYRDLVTSVSGHLYYNLECYYAAMLALPWGENAFRAWLRMIGFEENLALPKPALSPLRFWESTRVLWRLMRFSLFQSWILRRFFKRTKRLQKSLTRRLEECKTPKETLGIFLERVKNSDDLALGVLSDFVIMRKFNQDH
ncbi:MAG: PEP/pyruvate-binding domain-containing protein, partial [Bdellovibrionales bacterium]|nr:PEP/pyruvate-binding domain-containing protein [Bdellovibrionales bacterium]